MNICSITKHIMVPKNSESELYCKLQFSARQFENKKSNVRVSSKFYLTLGWKYGILMILILSSIP